VGSRAEPRPRTVGARGHLASAAPTATPSVADSRLKPAPLGVFGAAGPPRTRAAKGSKGGRFGTGTGTGRARGRAGGQQGSAPREEVAITIPQERKGGVRFDDGAEVTPEASGLSAVSTLRVQWDAGGAGGGGDLRDAEVDLDELITSPQTLPHYLVPAAARRAREHGRPTVGLGPRPDNYHLVRQIYPAELPSATIASPGVC